MTIRHSRIPGVSITAALALIASTFAVLPGANAAPALEENAGNHYFFKDSLTGGNADRDMYYGRDHDVVFTGDWNGDRRDTVGVNRGAQFFVKNSFESGPADIEYVYGNPDDEFLIGDWDGDGIDTVMLRRGNQFFVRNSHSSGGADSSFTFGQPGDEIVAGDWDGDGIDTLAIRRGNTFVVSSALGSEENMTSFTYGRDSDTLYTGDWDGDGRDSFTVRRGNRFYINNSPVSGGYADTEFTYGRDSDAVLVGDWDGDGRDTLAVRRGNPAAEKPAASGGYPIMMYGTLRQGEEAAFVANGYTSLRITRAPELELWITGPRWNPWPWALPGTRGLEGDLLTYGPWNYQEKIAQMDDWEGFIPGGDRNRMNYTRELVGTNDGLAWLYLSTPWRQDFARRYGYVVPHGDFHRF
ncbi:gamma-glutamylcyclotransferase [Actinotignum sp. GS-2025a]|uniref:gamma-glutamylcyclotransferase n=1 Tax=Actinotignum sp. GS-2025a TaxID=3427274 RepID=UPI003F462CA8